MTLVGRLRVVQNEEYFTSVDLGVFMNRDRAAHHAGEAPTELGDCRRDYRAALERAVPNRKRARDASFAGHRWLLPTPVLKRAC